jgi:hypothetical protein
VAALGSFSPSDASSIESEADDLLHGMHSSHVSRSLAAPRSAAATRASPHAAKGDAATPSLVGDADGIDDVLRLQPWLTE